MLFFILYDKIFSMKQKTILLILTSLLLVGGCSSNQSKNNNGGSSGGSGGGGGGGGSNPPSGPTKVTVAAHTLRDSNPPVTDDDDGEEVSESTWNSFLNGSNSAFINNYNYTYTAYYGGDYQMEFFTRNGYCIKSYLNGTYSSIYYERKSGSTFYVYTSVSDGYLRSETTLDLQSKYTGRFISEINSNHMFAYSNYTFNGYYYQYITSAFAANVEFKKGYLTYMYYLLAGSPRYSFEINYMFETTIDIPKSYYYE